MSDDDDDRAYCFVCGLLLDGRDDGERRYCGDGCRAVQERAEREEAACGVPAGPDVPY